MNGSFKIFSWLGIPVYLHWTFGLIFVYVLWHAQTAGLDTLETVWITGLFLSLFVCVLLHEFGHAIAAKRYGVSTRDIVLMPIGGVARLEKMPEKPVQEFVVAIAGPAVNVVIATLLFIGMGVFSDGYLLEMLADAIQQDIGYDVLTQSGQVISPGLHFAIKLAITNVALVIFNMLPAFPMDGGRVFRSLLSMWIGRPKATKIAAWLGQTIALMLIMLGLWGGDRFYVEHTWPVRHLRGSYGKQPSTGRKPALQVSSPPSAAPQLYPAPRQRLDDDSHRNLPPGP
jgi:Zn-dependent protease